MKMKSIITGIAPAILITGMGLVACQKNVESKASATAVSSDLQMATKVAASQSFINVADAEQFAFAINPKYAATDAALTGSCPPIVTYSPSADVYPHTITVDYGTGCTSAAGLVRSGKWMTEYTGDMAVLGSSTTTTYDNYYIDGIKIEGKLKIAHNRETAFPHDVYRITYKDRKVIQTNGDYTIYGGNTRVVKKDDEPQYPGFPDGFFRVTGTTTGDVMLGGVAHQWVSTIDDSNPLIYNYCEFIVRGQSNVTFTNHTDWLVNYGNTGKNNCDDQAEITQDGVTTTVTLPLQF